MKNRLSEWQRKYFVAIFGVAMLLVAMNEGKAFGQKFGWISLIFLTVLPLVLAGGNLLQRWVWAIALAGYSCYAAYGLWEYPSLVHGGVFVSFAAALAWLVFDWARAKGGANRAAPHRAGGYH